MGEFREPRFDITRCSSSITGEYVSPVTLHIDEQVLLPKLNQCISDRGISMGVILHGLAYNIGYLVVPAIVHLTHGMKDTALDGF